MPSEKYVQDLNGTAVDGITTTGPGPWMPNLAKSGGWLQGSLGSGDAGHTMTWTIEATNDPNPGVNSPVVTIGGPWSASGAYGTDAGEHSCLAKWIRYNLSVNSGTAKFLHAHD